MPYFPALPFPPLMRETNTNSSYVKAFSFLQPPIDLPALISTCQRLGLTVSLSFEYKDLEFYLIVPAISRMFISLNPEERRCITGQALHSFKEVFAFPKLAGVFDDQAGRNGYFIAEL